MDEGNAGGWYHEPVLGREVLDVLDLRPGGLYLDGTVGGGGHARLLLERCSDCRLVAVDRDADALAHARRVLEPWADRVRFVHARFDHAVDDVEVKERGLEGALLDLGVSSRQLDADGRGFTYRAGAPLDMRMDPDAGGETAAELLQSADHDELVRLFRELAEEPRARQLAATIVRRRGVAPLTTSDHLVSALAAAVGREPSHQEKARVFQALRIRVNGELESLEAALEGIREALVPGGVMAVIAYHSLEDRLAKHAFREWSRDCVCPPELPMCRCRGHALGETLTRRPITPGPEEIERNPRARSAHLRAWRKAA
jgi:16S rRNA (cytosine1402-N4)-methyltransferase